LHDWLFDRGGLGVRFVSFIVMDAKGMTPPSVNARDEAAASAGGIGSVGRDCQNG
jgi:hypothetical protein